MRFQVLTQEIVPDITHWFDDEYTQKYLGNEDWLNRAVSRFHEAIGKEFRGARVIDRIGYVFYKDNEPVSYIETEVYDSLSVVDRVGDEIIIKDKKDLITASIVFVVAPSHRDQGIAKESLAEFFKLDRFKGVQVFVAGTEEDNVSSMKLLQSLGFNRRNTEPDFEDMINWELKK